MENKKYSEYPLMDLEEFKNNGYLQEVNRRFFHPIGLALELEKTANGLSIKGVRDLRSSPEGIIFAEDVVKGEEWKKKVEFINEEMMLAKHRREGLYQYFVQPA